jgi:hypothetical protein
VETDSISGTVLNSVTKEPIARALVASPDSHFAAMTDGQGHFEFTFPRPAPEVAGSGSTGSNRPANLLPSKPGYLTDPNQETLEPTTKEITLWLTQEALVAGFVRLSSSEPADRVTVELFRRQVEQGRAHWITRAQITTRSTGEFRFAGLPAGNYKLLVHEDAQAEQDAGPSPGVPGSRPKYVFTPVYFPNAADFAAADVIAVAPGQTFQADVVMNRQRYYPVRITVNAPQPIAEAIVNVHPASGPGPGYTLDYQAESHSIEGLLPQGVYGVEALADAGTFFAGETSLTVRDALVSTARITLAPTRSIPVHVKEEFSSPESDLSQALARNAKGPRRYFDIHLIAEDSIGDSGRANLLPPAGRNDESLALGNVAPGRYWVDVESSRGYVAAVTSGGIDLEHEPLVVDSGGPAPTIEVTVRDDGAQIEGTVEGGDAQLSAGRTLAAAALGITLPGAQKKFAYVYCVPLPDSSGRFTEVDALPDGTFTALNLPPGTYRVLAFQQPAELEYLNPEAMRQYEAQGQVVRVSGGQTEHVSLTLTPTATARGE